MNIMKPACTAVPGATPPASAKARGKLTRPAPRAAFTMRKVVRTRPVPEDDDDDGATATAKGGSDGCCCCCDSW